VVKLQFFAEIWPIFCLGMIKTGKTPELPPRAQRDGDNLFIVCVPATGTTHGICTIEHAQAVKTVSLVFNGTKHMGSCGQKELGVAVYLYLQIKSVPFSSAPKPPTAVAFGQPNPPR